MDIPVREFTLTENICLHSQRGGCRGGALLKERNSFPTETLFAYGVALFKNELYTRNSFFYAVKRRQ